MDAVEGGQAFTVTRDGHPIAELLPLRRRRRFVPRSEFAAMSRTAADISLDAFRADQDTMLRALPAAFPWVRHLSAEESRQFVAEVVDATHDAAQLDAHANLHLVVVEVRATARILADPELTAQLTRRLPGEDHGEVIAP